MAFVSYYPSSVFDQLRQQVNSLYGLPAVSPRMAHKTRVVASGWMPAVDIKEEESRFVLRADLPGVDPANVDVQIENGVLTVRGERKLDDSELQACTHIERPSGTFLRRFTLPDSADTANVNALSKHGVVEITVGKKPAVLPRKIAVNS